MQFINIVVHSVEDMNFRVHLQYEYTKLGLDDYLEVRWPYSVNRHLDRDVDTPGELYGNARLSAAKAEL